MALITFSFSGCDEMTEITVDSLPRRFSLTKSNLVMLSIFGILPAILFAALGMAILLSRREDPAWIGVAFFLAGMGLFFFVLRQMLLIIELREWEIACRGLFGKTMIPIGRVISLSRKGARGTRVVFVRSPDARIAFSNQTFSDADLDAITEFIYRGAEATSNEFIRRPPHQRGTAEIPQRSFKDITQR